MSELDDFLACACRHYPAPGSNDAAATMLLFVEIEGKPPAIKILVSPSSTLGAVACLAGLSGPCEWNTPTLGSFTPADPAAKLSDVAADLGLVDTAGWRFDCSLRLRPTRQQGAYLAWRTPRRLCAVPTSPSECTSVSSRCSTKPERVDHDETWRRSWGWRRPRCHQGQPCTVLHTCQTARVSKSMSTTASVVHSFNRGIVIVQAPCLSA